MAVLSEQSYINKIKDFKIISGTFKNDDGQEQPYKSIQIVVTSDGTDETIVLSGGSAVKPSALNLALKGADIVNANDITSGSFLEDSE